MKKFRDISQTDDKNDIDIASLGSMGGVTILREGRNIHRDIGELWREDIQIWEKIEIQVLKKRWKNFDALEKQGFMTSLFRWDVTVWKKNKSLSLHEFYVRCTRYLKWCTRQGIIFFLCCTFLVCFVLWFLDKIFVENRVNAWYSKLLEVREWSIPLEQIQKKINNSRYDLLLADAFFTPFKVFPWDKINAAEHIISGGRHLTHALDDILWLYSKVDNFTKEKELRDIYFTQLFLNISDKLINIESSLEKSLYHYKSIEWLPSKELEQQRQGNIIKIEKILSRVQTLNKKYPDFLKLLWHEERKRYLIVFQNADEIRPTWWFMWSMWLLEIFKGKVQLFQKKDVYAIEWDLKTADYERLEAPKWINELTESFWLRDANYFANLRDSSNGIKFFTDNAGIDIDGIVYINQNTLLHFLEVTWPIYFPPLDIFISSENFSEMMSLVVEAKIFKWWTLGSPKQVLFDFMEVFTKQLIDQWKYFDYLQVLVHDAESRDIMMWSFDEWENSFLTDMSLNGKVDYDSSLDFTYPVYTSLSGNKSDRYMKRSYTQRVTSWVSCSYDVEFEIQSQHSISAWDIQNIENTIWKYELSTPNLMQIQWNAKNRQFVRVILPSSAKIYPRDDFEIVNYGTRRGIEFFLDTEPSQTSFYNFNYSLPNPECRNYDYTLYKQPWVPEHDIFLLLNGKKYTYTQRTEDFYFELREWE